MNEFEERSRTSAYRNAMYELYGLEIIELAMYE